MFVQRTNNFKGLLGLLALLAAFVAFGCGDSDAGGEVSGDATITIEPDGGIGDGAEPPQTPPEVENPDVADADPADVEVIDEWSRALSEGDVEAAADYFATPSITENGPTLRISNTKDAIAFNQALPCGAALVSAESTGEITTAVFLLSERPGGGCGPGTGGMASTSFIIEDDKIVEWRRVGTDLDDGEESAPTV